jgi:hypothetical protein
MERTRPREKGRYGTYPAESRTMVAGVLNNGIDKDHHTASVDEHLPDADSDGLREGVALPERRISRAGWAILAEINRSEMGGYDEASSEEGKRTWLTKVPKDYVSFCDRTQKGRAGKEIKTKKSKQTKSTSDPGTFDRLGIPDPRAFHHQTTTTTTTTTAQRGAGNQRKGS